MYSKHLHAYSVIYKKALVNEIFVFFDIFQLQDLHTDYHICHLYILSSV